MGRALLVLALALAFCNSNAYRFRCIDRCVCDTDDQLIDCHNRDLQHFPALDGFRRLRGYTILSLRQNDIAGDLPDESQLKEAFPDLEAIDLHGNSRLDCPQLIEKYPNMVVLSHCDNPGQEPDQEDKPNIDQSTSLAPCDWKCELMDELERQWLQFNAYAQHVGRQVKNRLRENRDKIPYIKKATRMLSAIFGEKEPQVHELTQ